MIELEPLRLRFGLDSIAAEGAQPIRILCEGPTSDAHKVAGAGLFRLVAQIGGEQSRAVLRSQQQPKDGRAERLRVRLLDFIKRRRESNVSVRVLDEHAEQLPGRERRAHGLRGLGLVPRLAELLELGT